MLIPAVLVRRSITLATNMTASLRPANLPPFTRLLAATTTVSFLKKHCAQNNYVHLLCRNHGCLLTAIVSSHCCTELFVNAPHESISYIWQVFGCRHSLQPTDNDYEQPSVPALKFKGFVRWESIQILLAPEEHVPFVLYAVKNWHLKNPDTGDLFPTDLPVTAFPSEPDPDITAWHAACGDKLKKEATPKDSPRPGFTSAADRVNAGFSHVPAFADAGGASRAHRPTTFGSDYFNQAHRPVPFSHVSPGHASGRYSKGSSLRVSPERGERMRHNGHGLSPEDERVRRRSFSDYPSPNEPHPEHLHVPRPTTFRRHSHPRRFSDDESETDSDASPRTSRRGSAHYPQRNPKVVPHFVHVPVPAKGPPGGTPPVVSSSSTTVKQGSRSDGGVKLRSDERDSPVTSARRKTAPVVEGAKDWAKEKFDKFSGMFAVPSPSERPRRSPGSSGNVSSGTTAVDRSRDTLHGSSSRLSQSHSYDDDDDETDSERERLVRERRRLRERQEREERARRERERDAAAYDRDRARDRLPRRSRDTPPDWDEDFARDRDRDRDRDRVRGRRDKDGINASARYVRRPDPTRRTSSHADVDRIDREKHSRMYDMAGDRRDRDRDRDRYVDDNSSSSRRRREERERERERERGASPVIKGVSGRRYPTTEPPWTQESP